MAEIIAAPSALSKIIPISFKINDTNSVTTTRLATKKQFNTTDTDAWLSFTLEGIDASLAGEYDLTMINVDENPSSIVNHTNIAFSGIPFHYKMDSSADLTKNEIRHAGRWMGQVVVRLTNGDTTTRQFDFAITGHLLDGKEARLILIEDYNALMATITTSKDELAQYNIDYAALIETVTTQEAARVQAELTRAQTFDALVESEMVAQNVATKLTEKEATFAPRMLSVEQQLEQAEADILLINRGLGTTISSLALLNSTYPTGDTKDHIVAGNIAEVDTLTVTAIPTVASNITITLNGVAKTVAVDPAVQTTTALVAALIRGNSFPGWTTGGTGSVVTFTATTTGARTAPTFAGGTTGVTATFAITIKGEDANYHRYFWSGTAWTDGGAYQAIEITNKAVTVDKTDFAQRTNLFNYQTFTIGKKINANVGVNNIFTDYATVAWALVSPVYNVVAGETYTVKITSEASPDINKIVFGDATNKVSATISFAPYATTLTFTVPANAIYMRINSVKSGVAYEQFMLVRGSVMPATFVPYAKYTAPDLTITDDQVPSVPTLKTDVTTLKSDVLALKTVASNQWTGKKAVAYGCSITEMLASNGDSWEVKVKAALGFDKFYNRGKGGSTMSNIDTEGSMYIYVNSAQWDETATSVNASAGEFDGGVTVKWINPWYVNPERIVTIPTDADLILIDASTNDFYRRTPLGTLPFKNPWEVSQTGAIVYDKGTLTGAIGSLVTQLQARCPNAKIVFWGMPYNDGITAASGDLFFEYYAKIQETVRRMGCEFIDVESKMQVNINNLTTTFTDGVHPATTARGLNLLTNAIVAGLKDIYPLPAV